MKNENYKYDVAFSFLNEDENLAIKFNELLKNNTKPFYIQSDKKKLRVLMVRKPLVKFSGKNQEW